LITQAEDFRPLSDPFSDYLNPNLALYFAISKALVFTGSKPLLDPDRTPGWNGHLASRFFAKGDRSL